MEKTLILLRGVPGSGKSTEAQRIVAAAMEGTAVYFEADMFFGQTGEYLFDPSKLPEAHRWCQRSTKAALADPRIETVIVSNTFIKRWELEPYLEMAEGAGVKVVIRRMTTLFHNAHGVPADKVQSMLDRMEPFDGEELVGA